MKHEMIGDERPEDRVDRINDDALDRTGEKQRAQAIIWLAPTASGVSLDWKNLSAADITKRVTSKVQPGSIVLFHNAAKHTPEALPGIIEALLQEGYTFVLISEIILKGDHSIDHTDRQNENNLT